MTEAVCVHRVPQAAEGTGVDDDGDWRLVIVLEYEVGAGGYDVLGRIVAALRHEPVEGARHVRTSAAIREAAARIVAELPP